MLQRNGCSMRQLSKRGGEVNSFMEFVVISYCYTCTARLIWPQFSANNVLVLQLEVK